VGVHSGVRRELLEQVTGAATGLRAQVEALAHIHRHSAKYQTEDYDAVKLAIFAAHGWSDDQETRS
jgi:hypothetical protein